MCLGVFSLARICEALLQARGTGRPVLPPAPNSAPGRSSALITVASPPVALSPAPSTFPHHHPEGARSLGA